MKYCTKCKKIFTDDKKENCPVCSREMISDPSHHSPVNIVTANGFELERIKAALTNADIPFSVQEEKDDAGLQILNSAPLENNCVFVPLSFYTQSRDLLIGIGALTEAEEISDDDEMTLLEQREKEFEVMSPQKRFWVKLFSIIGFILIIAATVLVADFIGRLINPNFQ